MRLLLKGRGPHRVSGGEGILLVGAENSKKTPSIRWKGIFCQQIFKAPNLKTLLTEN